jgi:multidrug efflux system outer membrane protein
MQQNILLLVLAFFTIVSAACASRRPYVAPAIDPAALSAVDASFVTTQPFDARWWSQFEDPVLDTAITKALAANHDVRIAAARVEQARAFTDEVQRDRYPTVTVGAAVDRRDQAIPGFADEPRAVSTYSAGFDAFWELDLFGRVRSQLRAAEANAQSFEASLSDVRVRVVGEVARNYFELRGLQQQLAVAEQSLTNQRETLRITTVRRDAGIGEEQDVASAAARVAAIEATIPGLRGALAQREHRIAVLVGERPGALVLDLAPRPYPSLARALAIGDPGEILRRRPDVRVAERRLASVTALEAVAAAELYPRITLSGFLGFIAGRGSLFGSADSRAWAVTPALSWAAFDLGSARARLRGAGGATQEAVAAFEQTVLTALEDTATSLSRYREEQQRLVRLVDQARESARAADIARTRYREGAVDFLTLLDAERTELQARDSVAQAEAGVFTSVVAVYKALGGGV